MTDLATEVIAIRAAVGWLIGLVSTGFISAHLAALPNGPRSGWVLLSILASRIPLLLGPAGVGLIAGRLARGLTENMANLAVGISVVASLWLSMIAAQVAQNTAHRLIGAKTEPIRW